MLRSLHVLGFLGHLVLKATRLGSRNTHAAGKEGDLWRGSGVQWCPVV